MNWTPFLALLTGGIVGVVFNLTDLPVPAPAKLAGVMGIVGIYAGYNLPKIWNYLLDALVG